MNDIINNFALPLLSAFVLFVFSQAYSNNNFYHKKIFIPLNIIVLLIAASLISYGLPIFNHGIESSLVFSTTKGDKDLYIDSILAIWLSISSISILLLFAGKD